MEKRSFWKKMFGEKDTPMNGFTRFQMMNGYSPIFSTFGTNAYSSDIVRSTVHAIASNAAKLKPKHIRSAGGQLNPQDSALERLLALRPNPIMNAYVFYYKVVTQLMMKSNAFILIQTDAMGGPIGFFPLAPILVEVWEHSDETYLKFYFANGKTLTQPYENIIHLRRYFNESDMFGEGNELTLLPTLELINTTNQGIINAIKSSAYIRGVLKFIGMLKDADMAAARDRFVKEYLGADNNGGVGATDGKFEFVPIENKPQMADAKQMDLIDKKVYKYFNVNEKIVTSSYNENEWNAFYESIIEPISLQLGLEFTSKLFTRREREFGNVIVFEANRLQYASTSTKLSVIEKLVDRGLMNRNEGREIFNMGPVPDGEKYVISLNYVQVDKANQYQLGKDDPPADPNNKEVDPNADPNQSQ